MSSLFYYYNFLEKQLFNERKALFTQFVEKVSENIDSEIRMLWDDTDSLEKLIHTVLIGTFIKKMLILKSLIYLLQNVVH